MEPLYSEIDYHKKPVGQWPVVLVLLSFCLLLFAAAAYLIIDFLNENNRITHETRDTIRLKMVSGLQNIDRNFSKLMRITDGVAADLSKNKYSQGKIQQMATDILKQNSELLGFAVAYEPYQYESGRRLFAPFSYRKEGVIYQVQVEGVYDYTQADTPGGEWYVKPLGQGAGWSEPYYGTASASFLIAYSVPFYGPNSGGKKPEGVIAAVCSLDQINELTKTLQLDGSGYTYLLSKRGVFIAHPNQEYVETHQNIFNTLTEATMKKNPELKTKIKKALTGQSVTVEYQNEVTGQDSWIIFEPLPAAKYVMGAVFIKSSVNNHKDFTRRRFILISLFMMTGVFLLLFILFRGYELSTRSLWLSGITLTALLIAEIFTIWFLTINYTNYNRPNAVKVVDNSILNHYLNYQSEVFQKRYKKLPVYIPTGVFVQSLEFEGTNNVKMTGYIWQKYDKSIPKGIAREITLPESVEETIEEAYHREIGGVETIGWHFETLLRQSFDYYRYPFDNKDVWLRIWPKDFDKNIILVPDLKTYKTTAPDSLPGLEKDFVLPGWRLVQSFFSYVPTSKNTNFGIDNYIGQENFPELYYSVLIDREFLNPFIANLLPFIVMAFILFGTLLLLSFAEEKAEKFQSSIGGTLAGCAGLFFSVIIAHIQLRNEINTDGILYMEYFYFVLYAAILLVIVNAFLVAFESKLTVVRFRDNLLPKSLLWPSLLTVILIITLFTFY